MRAREIESSKRKLEAACHAAHALMRARLITPDQYGALNEAIWNIERKIN
jgi:ribosome-associated translation inhibitor RaiA